MINRPFLYILILLALGSTFGFYAFVIKNPESQTSDVVRIKTGLISGVKSSSQVVAFKGIPFAAPPVGALRWQAPQPPASWQGVRRCDVFGPSPMQSKPVPFNVYTSEFLIPETPISEDCLYLNVWTGAKPNTEKRPVFVWIYGGGFSSGGSGVPIYDGEAMAKKGIVFVSINYRVGVFGFMAHPALTKESEHNASGNYGLLDQIAALQWIQKNIEAFGGDPDNVAIAGQSAGSMSVNCLVASPLAKGLFHKAIAESGSNMLPNSMISTNTLQKAEEQGSQLAQALQASSLEELRKMPAQELMEKAEGRFFPIVDGYVLPQFIPAIFAQGKQADVPLLTGWNADEGFVSEFKNKEEFRQDAQETYGQNAATFLSYFPAATDEEAAASQIALSRDQIFALSNYTWANLQSDKGKAHAYVYFFTRKPPATTDYVKYGAFHTAEVAYALDNLKFLHRPWEPADHRLASTISSYWANFAATGDPNGKGLPEWPVYHADDTQVMVLKEKPEAEKLPGKAGLDFLYQQATGSHP